MTTIPAWALGQGAAVQIPKDETQRSTFRFFVERDKEKQVIFLHGIESAVVIWEHQVKLMRKGKPSWNNYFTCLQSMGMPCPLCRYAQDMGQFQRSAVQLFTVLDLTPWEDGKKVKHPYSKVVLAAKKSTQGIIVRRHLDLVNGGNSAGLLHAKFKIYRGPGDKDPAAGTDYQFMKYTDLVAAKVPVEDTTPVSLDEFAPNPQAVAEVISRLRGGSAPVASSGGPSLLDDDDLSPPADAGGGPVANIECEY